MQWPVCKQKGKLVKLSELALIKPSTRLLDAESRLCCWESSLEGTPKDSDRSSPGGALNMNTGFHTEERNIPEKSIVFFQFSFSSIIYILYTFEIYFQIKNEKQTTCFPFCDFVLQSKNLEVLIPFFFYLTQMVWSGRGEVTNTVPLCCPHVFFLCINNSNEALLWSIYLCVFTMCILHCPP